MPSALDAIRFKIVTIERRARWIAEMEKDLNEFHNVSGLCTRSALVGLYYYLTTTTLFYNIIIIIIICIKCMIDYDDEVVRGGEMILIFDRMKK